MAQDLVITAEAAGWSSNALRLPEEIEARLDGALQREVTPGKITEADLEALARPSETPDSLQVVKRLGGCDVMASEQRVRELYLEGLRTRLAHKVHPEEVAKLVER